jgi:hypothetical protein
MQEFHLNEFLTVKLEEDETIIYVNGEEFIQCKGVVMNWAPEELKYLFFKSSIDELADKSKEEDNYLFIPPETEFLVHCSNLQA